MIDADQMSSIYFVVCLLASIAGNFNRRHIFLQIFAWKMSLNLFSLLFSEMFLKVYTLLLSNWNLCWN